MGGLSFRGSLSSITSACQSRLALSLTGRTARRSVSINSAINRGIYRSRGKGDPRPRDNERHQDEETRREPALRTGSRPSRGHSHIRDKTRRGEGDSRYRSNERFQKEAITSGPSLRTNGRPERGHGFVRDRIRGGARNGQLDANARRPRDGVKESTLNEDRAPYTRSRGSSDRYRTSDGPGKPIRNRRDDEYSFPSTSRHEDGPSADYERGHRSRHKTARDARDPSDPSSSLTKRTPLVPLSIPYTTPASEFLYGTSVVSAALRAGRRKVYKLYVYEGENREVLARELTLRKLARSVGAEAIGVTGTWLQLMDKMSKGRPHNGYILEASPLPRLPAMGLELMASPAAELPVTLGHQSLEEQAINGTNGRIAYDNGSATRFPFVLMLDSIVDPQNLGAILRTAYFLGVDAVAISVRSSAPLTSTVLKASAGASETIPIISVTSPQAFLSACSSSGWEIYAAVAPPSPSSSGSGSQRSSSYIPLSSLSAPLQRQPSILMLGSEGEGLLPRIRRKAHVEVGIESRRTHGQGGVDSLNVSVAAALLCQKFLAGAGEAGVSEDNVEPSTIKGPSTETEGHEHAQKRLF